MRSFSVADGEELKSMLFPSLTSTPFSSQINFHSKFHFGTYFGEFIVVTFYEKKRKNTCIYSFVVL